MLSTISDWLKRFWILFVGFVTVITAITVWFQFMRDIKEVRATPTLTPTNPPTLTLTPTSTSIFTPGPFQFIELPKQVVSGNDVRIVVQAPEDAFCHLDYFTPDGNQSTASGLGSTTPDSRERCTWEWHIQARTSSGVGKLIIEINDLKETHEVEILPRN